MTRSDTWLDHRRTKDAALFAQTRRVLVDNYDKPESLSSFGWPEITDFNWALHWFDLHALDNHTAALIGANMSGATLEVSYEALSRASDGVAVRLREAGVRPGDRLVIDFPSCCELWALLLGVLKCGAVCIPIHHGLHSDSVDQRIATARPQLFLSTTAPSLTDDTVRALIVDDSWFDWSATSEFIPSDSRSCDEPAFGCFTSGTTGQPKLALHSNRTHGLAHLASLYWNRLDVGQRHLNISSPGWAKFFWSSLLVPLTSGATVIVRPDTLDPTQVAAFADTHNAQSLCAPVSVLRQLDLDAPPPGALVDIMSVGESVGHSTRDQILRAWSIRIREGFGQTEATAIMGELRCTPETFTVLPGYDIRLDKDPAWPADRLAFRSFDSGSFLGYMKAGVLERINIPENGWQWTGDYASGDAAAGTVRLLGRGDDVFRSNGHLVSPTDVEAVMEGHPSITSAAVIAVDHPHKGKVPHVFVTLAEKVGPQSEALLDWLNNRLPPEVDAADVHVVDGLPRSINGKIQRNVLAEHFHQT